MMHIFHYDHHTFPLPANHRFPAQKYALLRQKVQQANLVPAEQLVEAPAASQTQLRRAHNEDYLHRLQHGLLTDKEVRRIGLPWSPQLVKRVQHTVGATIAASRTALRDGVALTLGGGTHHACRDHGEGYCLYNDVVIAARTMQAEGRAKRIVIIDCDVHQGNGTADTAWGDSTIFTFSIHAEKNFPFRKIPGDLDIELKDGVGDEAYLEVLQTAVSHSLPLAQADLVIYLAGADPYEGDSLGRLALTKAGLKQRDELVLQTCKAAGIPIAITMAGGYSKPIDDTVEIYFETVKTAVSIFTQQKNRPRPF